MTWTKFEKKKVIPPDKYRLPNPTIEGWMLEEELDWLYQEAKESTTILEVGSWKGRSAHALASSGNTVIVVDTFKGTLGEIETAHQEAKYVDIFPAFILNVGSFDNLSVLRMESLAAATFFKDGSIDMVFLDASHNKLNFLLDLYAWKKKVKKLFCGHDLGEGSVKKVLEDEEIPYERGPGSIWYTRFLKSSIQS